MGAPYKGKFAGMLMQSDGSPNKNESVLSSSKGRIAVVIPSYNHGRFLRETLESVLHQTRRADRIIVLDDGSRDDSLAVLESFKSQGVEVDAQSNHGAHTTLNRLIDMASVDCEFIAVLNSDDRYLPDRLELGLQAFEQYPTMQVVCTGLEVLEDGKTTETGPEGANSWFQKAWQIGQNPKMSLSGWLGQANFLVTTSNIIARTSYLKSYPLRNYRYVHDYFFLIQASIQEVLWVCPEVTLQYRVHAHNTIKEKSEGLMRELVRMNLDLYRQLAPQLQENERMRIRFYEYALNSWGSISSFHAGLLQYAFAKILCLCEPQLIEAVVHELKGSEFEHPPKAIANSLTNGSAYHRFAQSLSRSDKVSQNGEAADQWLAMKEMVITSKWLGVASLFGGLTNLRDVKGHASPRRLAEYKEACLANGWIRQGASLGSETCKAILKIASE